MKNLRQAAALVAVAGLGWPLAALAQDTAPDDETAAMMEAFEKAGTPGEHHARLDRMTGEWNVEVRFYMEPGGEPTVSRGTSEIRWVMDGRFVQETVTGEFMGDAFHGVGHTGYDNVAGEYEATWIDDHSTDIYMYTGRLDENGRLVLESEWKDPLTGETVMGRSVTAFPSADEMVVKGYEDRGDGEMLTMELRYSRKS